MPCNPTYSVQRSHISILCVVQLGNLRFIPPPQDGQHQLWRNLNGAFDNYEVCCPWLVNPCIGIDFVRRFGETGFPKQ
jgi:hypothetical protein